MFPILFEVFGVPVSSFGVLVALAVAIGTAMVELACRKTRDMREMGIELALAGGFFGVIGAKLWFVVENVVRGTERTTLELLLDRGGLTYYGGAFGGVLGLVLICAYYRVSPWRATLVTPIAGAVSQGVGRIGCFLVGDDYGRPTDLPWGVAFPDGAPPVFVPVHPTMLYEAAWLFAAAVLLHRRRNASPYLFGEYLVLAGIGRFATEALRINPALVGPFSNAQLIALLSIGLGIATWRYWHARGGLRLTDAPPQAASPPPAKPSAPASSPAKSPSAKPRRRSRSRSAKS